jgi:tRNA C32,U32 (ribose-2'-O)-methylase TrmJ
MQHRNVRKIRSDSKRRIGSNKISTEKGQRIANLKKEVILTKAKKALQSKRLSELERKTLINNIKDVIKTGNLSKKEIIGLQKILETLTIKKQSPKRV